MRLAYTEDTPDDYEPPFFQAGADVEAPHFRRRPFTL